METTLTTEPSVTPLSSLKGALVDFVKFSTWIYADYRRERAFLNQSGVFELQRGGAVGHFLTFRGLVLLYLLLLVRLFPPLVLRLECRLILPCLSLSAGMKKKNCSSEHLWFTSEFFSLAS